MRPRNGPYLPSRPSVAELAAGAALVDRRSGELLLLHERREDRWCFPKGHVEAGESLRQAALRELAEETGLSRLSLGPEIAEVRYRFFDRARRRNVLKTAVYFLAFARSRTLHPEPLFDGYRWVSPRRAMRMVGHGTDREVVAAARAALRNAPSISRARASPQES